MKTIKVEWKVSNKQHAKLLKCAKAWGHKRIAGYVKHLVETKVGKIEGNPPSEG